MQEEALIPESLKIPDSVHKEVDEDEAVNRRRLLLSKALEEEKEELEEMEEHEEIPSDQKSEEEYEYEDYDDESEDEGTLFAMRHRPTFVPKVGACFLV